MCFFFSFLPATIWVVLGYFLLFSSTKAEGGVRLLGRILAIWAFIIAAFFPLMRICDFRRPLSQLGWWRWLHGNMLKPRTIRRPG